MKKKLTIRPRAALLIGAAFVATPAFAQDAPAPQTVTPPPIMVTPAPAPAAPAPRVIQMQPASPVVQAVPETPVAAPAEPARTTRTTTTARQTRNTAQTRAPAPAAAAPAATAPAVTPAAETPAAPVATAPETISPPPLVETQPVADSAATTTATTSTSSSSIWPWLLGGIALVIAGLAALLLMRRREPEYVEEYREPVAVVPAAVPAEHPAFVAEPVNEAPVVEPRAELAGLPAAIPVAEPEVREAQAAVATAEDVSISEPAADDLAGIVDATAPVARRPWIELAMRPVRAGTDKDDAIVDFELTVGNSGDTAAKDVRISTFMLADAASESEIEDLMIEHRDDNAISPVTIEPGEGTRIDAHLAASKDELGRTFNPVVVAEARYTLPDGRQGRTSAAFKIGAASEFGIRPLSASRPFLTETVEAELYGVPEHA